MVIQTPDYTTLKNFFIIMRVPKETLLPTPETLPTSEPVTPQVSYTVVSGDLPLIYWSLYKKICIGMVFGAGKFVTAGTIYWRMKKNGVSVSTGSYSVTVNYYYTVQAFFTDIIAGDVLEIALWSSVTDSNYDYKAFQALFSRVVVLDKMRVLKSCNYSVLLDDPTLLLGTPTIAGRRALRPQHLDYTMTTINTPTVFEWVYVKDTYGMFRLHDGDFANSDTAIVNIHATSRPRYYREWNPYWTIFQMLVA